MGDIISTKIISLKIGITKMAETHVISGLIKKRAELLGQIDAYQKEIQNITIQLSKSN